MNRLYALSVVEDIEPVFARLNCAMNAGKRAMPTKGMATNALAADGAARRPASSRASCAVRAAARQQRVEREVVFRARHD